MHDDNKIPRPYLRAVFIGVAVIAALWLAGWAWMEV
jgi:hypothetical protein